MGKISLDKINMAYRRLVEGARAINVIVEEGEGWDEDHTNPLHDMKIRDDKAKELKTSLELFLASHYARMSPADLFRNVNYHEWFTVENFEAAAFVKKLHEAVGGKVDEIALNEKIKSAGHFWRYGTWDSKPKVADEAVRQFVQNNTVTGTIWIERYKHSHYTGRPTESRGLHRESRNAINCFLWLAHFLAQPQIGAESPSKFRCQIAIDGWPHQDVGIPASREFFFGPITKVAIYANSNVKFWFKKGEHAERVVRVIFGEPVGLIYRKTEIDPESIFRQETYKPQRVVRICKEVAA